MAVGVSLRFDHEIETRGRRAHPLNRCATAAGGVMLRSVRGVITVLVLASAIAGCDRKSYRDHAAIQVSSDSIPVFTWTPPCPVAGCTVYKPQPPALDPVWDILSSQSVVSPPLVYGRSPLPEGERRTTRHPAAGHRLYGQAVLLRRAVHQGSRRRDVHGAPDYRSTVNAKRLRHSRGTGRARLRTQEERSLSRRPFHARVW